LASARCVAGLPSFRRRSSSAFSASKLTSAGGRPGPRGFGFGFDFSRGSGFCGRSVRAAFGAGDVGFGFALGGGGGFNLSRAISAAAWSASTE
jgi:hypothetical protein